jgi:hypothetical protein
MPASKFTQFVDNYTLKLVLTSFFIFYKASFWLRDFNCTCVCLKEHQYYSFICNGLFCIDLHITNATNTLNYPHIQLTLDNEYSVTVQWANEDLIHKNKQTSG